jgi:hypothetical protein
VRLQPKRLVPRLYALCLTLGIAAAVTLPHLPHVLFTTASPYVG